MQKREHGEYVKFVEVVEAKISQSGEAPVQHLKAEIAALATELQDFNDRRVSAYGRVTEIVAKMRQLSAV
jgi:hypothetical protein